MIKPKGAEGKWKMESIDSHIPKKSKQVSLSDKHCFARNMVGCTNCATLMTVVSIIPMVLLSKGMGVQAAHERTDMLIKTVQIRENAKGQIILK